MNKWIVVYICSICLKRNIGTPPLQTSLWPTATDMAGPKTTWNGKNMESRCIGCAMDDKEPWGPFGNERIIPDGCLAVD